MAQSTNVAVTFAGPFGTKCIAVRAKLVVLANGTDTKAVLKQARGDRSEYFAWDATSKCYTAAYDAGLWELAQAIVARLNAEAATAPAMPGDKPSKSNIADVLGLLG
jgi:hypothetical protein